MLKYVLKRILSALVTIFFIITITFFLMKAIPGNPFAAEKMPNPEIEAAMMAKYGLDQPLWKQSSSIWATSSGGISASPTPRPA